MCGILGVFGKEQNFLNGINLLKKRGHDGFGFCTSSITFKTKNYSLFTKKVPLVTQHQKIGILIHTLHAIVGNVKQPLVNHDTSNCLIMNGEIYNWKELKKKYTLRGENDADVLFHLLEKYGVNAEKKIDGVFAYVYWDKQKNHAIISRDYLGEKPVCYYYDKETFAFASENKILRHQGTLLDPKHYLIYNIDKHKLSIVNKKSVFEQNKNQKNIKKTLKELINNAYKKRTNGLNKYGILFSGGIDSALLAFLGKKSKHNIVCYTAAFEDGNLRKAPDLEHAQKIAEKYGFTLKTKIVSLKELEKDIPKVIEIIESTDPIKVGVALPFYYCCKQAQKDRIKVILSGLGSEELFAGYNRHFEVFKKNNFTYKNNDINKECLRGLLDMWNRDLYRDDLITMHHTLELRLPFLDQKLVEFSLSIPEEMKINKEQKKIILREVAYELGLAKEFSQRPKVAAQYGSNFDKGLEKLAKKHGFKWKHEYLKSLANKTQDNPIYDKVVKNAQ